MGIATGSFPILGIADPFLFNDSLAISILVPWLLIFGSQSHRLDQEPVGGNV